MIFNLTKIIIPCVKNNFYRTMTTSLNTSAAPASFLTLNVNEIKPFVFHVELNRPTKLNAFNRQMVSELGQCFNGLNENENCRVIILSGSGKHFTSGLDLTDMMEFGQKMMEIKEIGRVGQMIGRKIRPFQEAISSLELCNKPVIVCIHAGCIGAGVDLVSTADIRYCTDDAWFQIKEVDLGMAADVGTLQRFPKAIGSQSLARELCLTARKFESQEALACGFISKKFDKKEQMIEECIKLGELIASKSPIAVQATKKNMIYSLEHTNQEGLDQIFEMNKMLLQSTDFLESAMAQATKGESPKFAKL